MTYAELLNAAVPLDGMDADEYSVLAAHLDNTAPVDDPHAAPHRAWLLRAQAGEAPDRARELLRAADLIEHTAALAAELEVARDKGDADAARLAELAMETAPYSCQPSAFTAAVLDLDRSA